MYKVQVFIRIVQRGPKLQGGINILTDTHMDFYYIDDRILFKNGIRLLPSYLNFAILINEFRQLVYDLQVFNMYHVLIG